MPSTSIVHEGRDPVWGPDPIPAPARTPIAGSSALREAMKTALAAQPDRRAQPADGDGGHPGRDLRRRVRLLDRRPALAVPGPGDGAAADVPAQHAAAAAPVRAARAAAGDDGAGRPLAPGPAARARHGHAGRLDRHPAAGGHLQPHAGAPRERAPALGRAGAAAPRRRSASASRATSTTRSTSRSPRCCCGSRPPPRTRLRRCSAQLAETKRLADQAMGELLDLARQLRPTALDDHGLVAALRTHVRELRPPRPGAAPASGPTRALGELSPDAQVVVYRVAQEALVNAARHSGATRIEVSLERRDSRVRLQVADNGTRLRVRRGGQGPGPVGHARARAARGRRARDRLPARARARP